MVLVDHQVPGGQVGVGLQLLPVGGALLGGGPGAGGFSCAPLLTLGDDGQLQIRVLQPAGQSPHREDDLPRLGQGLQGEVHPGLHLLLPQEGLEIQGTLLAGHQHQHGEARALVVGEVLHRRLQAGPEGGQLLGYDGQEALGVQRVGGQGEGVQIGERKILQTAAQPVEGEAQLPAGAVQLPPLQQGLYVLLQLPLVGLGPLSHPAALGQEDAGVQGQEVRRRGQLGVDEGQIPVGRRKGPPLSQGVPVLLEGDRQVLVSVPPGLGGELVQPLQQPGQPPLGELRQGLRRGQEDGPVHVLGAPLGGGIKGPHGVQLVPPELRPDGGGHAGGVHVQNTAPQGKLARPLHLVTADVAGGGEGLGEPVQVGLPPRLQHRAGGVQHLGRQGALLEGLHRGHQTGELPPAEPPQQVQPPVLPLVGDGGDAVEHEGAGGEHRDLPSGEIGQVPGHPPGLPLVGAHHHHGTAGLLPQGGGEVGPVDRRQAGDGGGGFPALQGGGQLLKFRQIF